MYCDAGTFATGTGTGDLAAQTPNLGGNAPQAGMLFYSASAGAGAHWCVGAFSGVAERVCASNLIVDAQATMDSGHAMYTDCIMARQVSTAAVDGKADLGALAADSFTPTIDDAFASDMTVGWWVIAGITAAECFTFQLTTGADQTIGSSDWDCVIFFGFANTIGSFEQHARPIIGFATATKNRCWVGMARDNVADTENWALISDEYCWANISATAHTVSDGVKVSSLTAGIHLTRVVGTNQPFAAGLALKGLAADILDSAMRLDTANQDFSGASYGGLNFTPQILMALLRPVATATQGTTPVQHLEGGVGYALSTTKRYANWIGETNGLLTSDPYGRQATNRVAIDDDRTDGSADQGDMDFNGFTGSGGQFDQITAGVAANYMPLLVLGSPALGGQYYYSTQQG